jgi:hypothetical protein
MCAPNQGAHHVGNWKRFKSPIRRKKAECEATSGDRTMGRNIDLDPTSSMRLKKLKDILHAIAETGRKIAEGEENDDEEAEKRRSRRKFTKRIAPILNLLTPEVIEESSAHEIMNKPGEN